jgi:cyclopropane fatty-acyl-phospholipid synthase-like methyltransferase
MSTVTDWWKDFFEGPFSDLQLAGINEERAKAEVDEIERRLELTGPSEILDAPCGTGRHSLELARRGHRVTGVDFNPKVIERARESAGKEGLSAEFRLQDLRHVDDEARFDAALCAWGSFGYFDEADNADHLCRVCRALRPGGRFFLDAHVAETLFHKYRTQDWFWWGEGEQRVRVLEERRFDCDTARMESTWTFQKNGTETSHNLSIRIYTYHDLRVLLEQVGFTSFSPADGQGVPLALGAQRLWLVARKPA